MTRTKQLAPEGEFSHQTQVVLFGLVCWVRTCLRVLFGPLQIAVGFYEPARMRAELMGFVVWGAIVLGELYRVSWGVGVAGLVALLGRVLMEDLE